MRRWMVPSAVAIATSITTSAAALDQTLVNEKAHPDGETQFPRNLTLKQVSVVFRHGARTPLTDKYIENIQWDDCGKYHDTVELLLHAPDGGPRPPSPKEDKLLQVPLLGNCHRGQLTTKGQQQALEFGRFLRKRYVETHMLLPREYQAGRIVGRTTNFSRTIATMRGVLTGMYPSNTTPPPCLVMDEVDEILYTNVDNCAALRDLVLKAKDRAIQASIQDTTTLASKIRDALRIPAHTPVNYVELHDVLGCRKFHGKPLQQGVTEEMMEYIDKLATRRVLSVLAPTLNTQEQGAHTQEQGSADVLRLGLGVLLQTIIDTMEQHAMDPDNQPSMYLYSAHDTTIMPLVVAMGVPIDTWPPYLSNLTFELWEGVPVGGTHGSGSGGGGGGGGSGGNTGGGGTAEPITRQYVRVLYNDEELKIPGIPLGTLCDLETFKHQVLGPYRLTPHDRDQECVLKFGHDTSAPQPIDAQTGAAVQGM